MYIDRDADPAGATSAGGLAAIPVKKFVLKPERNHQTNELRQNENRDIGTDNNCERSES